MSPKTLITLLTYYISLCFCRNYTIGVKVSSIWYSGSGDDMYFQLCNDNSNATTNCLEWYEISGGMENRGEWYNFLYNNQIDIGTITTLKLLTENNDQICIDKASIDEIKYDTGTGVVCMEVPEHKQPGCSIISLILSTSTFTNEIFEGVNCVEDISNAYTGPIIPIEPGTRTYEISLTVSSVFYSGTKNDLYLRLCADTNRINCVEKCDNYVAKTNCEPDWFVFIDGVNEEGNTYKGYWNTKDIGIIKFADIVIFGPDQFCLSRLKIDDKEANAGLTPECISDDTKDGCSTLQIDIEGGKFVETEVDPCGYGIMSNITDIFVDQYIFKFKIGSLIACGAEAPIYFIFCTIDGDYTNTNAEGCSKIYEIGGEMPDEDKEYTFTVDIRDYAIFNTINDIYFVDVWEYKAEYWCLSDISINGKILENNKIITGSNADSGTPSITIESPVEDGVFCTGVRVQMQTNTWTKFNDGPIPENAVKKCRWNTLKDSQGTVSVSKKSDNETIIDWMNKGYNWVYICVVLIGIVICCIVGCACIQAMNKKKKAEIEDTNRPWHGG
eukprot:1009779_1